MSKSKMILRTKFIDRACHWTVVISFFLVSLSGIALLAHRNFRYTANGANSTSVFRGDDFHRADVYVRPFCTPQHSR